MKLHLKNIMPENGSCGQSAFNLYLLSLVDFISSMSFKTKLANKCSVGSNITKEKVL